MRPARRGPRSAALRRALRAAGAGCAGRPGAGRAGRLDAVARTPERGWGASERAERDQLVPPVRVLAQAHRRSLANVAHVATPAAIRASGGVDLQILGIGTDGHLGFNEPGSSFASLTRVKTLTEQTRRDNSRFFDSLDDVPLHCVTQGVGTILRARHLVLLAFGEAKAQALQAAVEGPLTASVPASAVQLHAHVTVVVDEAAASTLAHADYYRYAYANKPGWQGL